MKKFGAHQKNERAFARQGKAAHRISHIAKRAALVAAALISCAGMNAGAEGSRDIVRTSIENAAALGNNDKSHIDRWGFMAMTGSFMGVNRQQKVKFYAYEGEKVYLASSAVNAAGGSDVIMTYPDGKIEKIDLTEEKGYIQTMKQEEAGPQGVYLPGADKKYDQPVGADGFIAYSCEIPQSGVYSLEFKASVKSTGSAPNQNTTLDQENLAELNPSNHVLAWDVTVTQEQSVNGKSADCAVNGRVWMDAVAIQTLGSSSGKYGYVYGDLYAVTRDGYIWKFSLNGMQPNTFSMYANARGGIGTGTNASAYHSVHSPAQNYTGFDIYEKLVDKYNRPDGLYILGPDNEVTDIDAPNHLFVNYPDVSIPDSVVPSTPQGMGEITNFTYDGHGEKTDSDNHEGIAGYVGVGGYFNVKGEGASSYRIIIDMSNMYATQYHGENGMTECGGDDSHSEEICLSTDKEDSFVYYNKTDKSWYSIRTNVKDSDGNWDRHPVNNAAAADGTITDKKISELVKFVKLSSAPVGFEEFTEDKLGEDFGEYKCLGRIMLGNAAVDNEEDRINWNGRDEYGRILPVGIYFGETGRGTIYCEPKAGEIHFPLGDVEHAANGVAIWLENPPDWVTRQDFLQEVKLRSSLYYNNEDKSLLRDFENQGTIYDGKTSPSADTNGNNAWVWNLPTTKSNSASGETPTYADQKDRAWAIYPEEFENQAIDGVASYKLDSGVVNSTSLTKAAAKAVSDGIDHGVADVWAHLVGTDKRVDLEQPIALYHYANQKMITGFVYLDTPKATGGIGVYSKLTDDRELPKAEVEAEYGKDAEGEPVVYHTETDTNGYYNIPINMDYFGEGDKKEVKITVTYEDPEIKNTLEAGDGTAKTAETEDITTYKVTTANNKSSQKIEGKPNVSVQTVSLEGGLKKIYAEDVGYTNTPTKYPIRIVKIWDPITLKDNSMSAKFIIKGILESSRDKSMERQNDPAFDGELLFRSDEISVDEAMGGVTVIDSLPEKTYQIQGEKTKNVLSSEIEEEAVSIVYKVEEKLEGNGTTTDCKVEEYKPETTNSLTYDNWTFTNHITPSTLKETVWYDANNNGEKDDDELPIKGAVIQIAKRDEKTGVDGDVDADDRYKDFNYAKYEEEGAGTAADPTLETRTRDEQSITDEEGIYSFDGKLIAGRYRVTVTLPSDLLYNASTYTGDGTSAKAGETDNSVATIKGGSVGTTVTQYFDVGIGSDYELRVGYGFMGGLSIRKNIEVESVDTATEGEILEQIQQEPFTFELQLAAKPNGTEIVEETLADGQATAQEMAKRLSAAVAKKLGIAQEKLEGSELDPDIAEKIKAEFPVGSVVTAVETFDLDIGSGAEKPAEQDMYLVFTEIKETGTFNGRWSAVFKLKSGQRITVPNVDAETEYWLWEYDNETGSGDDAKNGSDKNTGTGSTPLTYMPKGYSLAKLVGSRKMRNGKVPSTSRTVLVSYTNIYNPLPAEAYGGDGSGTTGYDTGWDKALDIEADVRIVSGDPTVKRYYQAGDQFKLLLEPIEGKSNDGKNTPIDIPAFQTASEDVSATEEQINAKNTSSVTAQFTDDSSVTFTQAGTYYYLLREARPFYDEGVEAIPGISYAPEQYRLTLTVEHTYQQLKITEAMWEKWDGTTWKKMESGDRIVFTNTFHPSELKVVISGKKILDSKVSGVTLENLAPFSFTLEPAGVKEDRSVEEYEEGETRDRDKDGFDIEKETLQKQPMPEGAKSEGADVIPTIQTNVSTSVSADSDNVIFDDITFSAEDAGADLAHAAVYKYLVKENIPAGAVDNPKDGVTYDASEQAVYIRVYKEVEVDAASGTQMQVVVAEMCDKSGMPAAFNDDFVFTNKYAADTTVSLGAGGLGLALKKIIATQLTEGEADLPNRGFRAKDTDKGIAADHFRFVLEPKDGAPAVEGGILDFTYTSDMEESVESDDTGKDEKTATLNIPYQEGAITFTDVGTYVYTLREINPLIAGMEDYKPIVGFSYDPAVYEIKIVVENGKSSDSGEDPAIYNGKLTAKITEIKHLAKSGEETGTTVTANDITFKNVYNPYSASVTIAGEKVLDCEDPDVTLERFKDSDGKGAFRFRLTPEGSAELAALTENGALAFKEDPDQPMPEDTDEPGAGSAGEKRSKTVSNKGSEVNFGELTFNLDDVDQADGGSAEDPLIYRYKVEELLAERAADGSQNAADSAGNPINGTSVDPEKNDDGDEATAANERYVYFKVYNQRQDGQDHVVATRCDSRGQDITAVTDFTITNTYQAQELNVPLSDLIGVQKMLKNESEDPALPESAVFKLAVEALDGAPLETREDEGEAKTAVQAAATVESGAGSGTPGGSETAEFSLDGIGMTFRTSGVYEYTLRELDPFLGDGADIVPGVIYDYYRYKLCVTVENEVADGKLTVASTKILYSADNGASWENTDTLDADRKVTEIKKEGAADETVTQVKFVNRYKGSSASLRVLGYKVLDGRKTMNADEYSFTLEPAGVATLSAETASELTFDNNKDTLAKMPLPVLTGEESGTAPVTVKNGEGMPVDVGMLSRSVVDFGTVTFTDEHAPEIEDTQEARVYRYRIKEVIPEGAEPTVTYDTDEKYLYIRVYRITTVNPASAAGTAAIDQAEQMRQTVVAEFCDESGRTGTAGASGSFTFTNIYTAPPLSVKVNDLLGKDILKKLTVEAGTFLPEAKDEFGFVFYPASYPQLNEPMPLDEGGNPIPRLIKKIQADELEHPTGTAAGGSEFLKQFTIAEETTAIAFDSAQTYTYRIRELNPENESDKDEGGSPLAGAVRDVTYDTGVYTLKVVVDYNGDTGRYQITETELTNAAGEVISRRLLGEDGNLTAQTEGVTAPESATLNFVNTYEERHSLTYEGNKRNDGDSVYDVPDMQEYAVGEEVTLSDKTPLYVAAGEGQNRNVLFLGWSTKRVEKILARGDDDGNLPKEAKDTGSFDAAANVYYPAEGRFTMPSADVTLYALWGYDDNGNGTADVWETMYRLTYDGCPITEPGTVQNVPAEVTGLLQGEQVYLADGASHGLLPKHDNALYEKTGGTYPVVFIGWTETRPSKIYAKDDTVTDVVVLLGEYVVMPDENVTVYAAWGYDMDGNGTADVLDTRYSLIYDDNADADGSLGGSNTVGVMPDSSGVTGNNLTGAVVELDSTTKPTHSPTADGGVCFLGWTAQPQKIFTRESDAPELITSVTFVNQDITVYAAWGLDSNNNGTADVYEDDTLIYDGNPQAGGLVGDVPESVSGLLEKDEVTLKHGPRHSAVDKDGLLTDVAFIGWTETAVEDILGKNDTRLSEEDSARISYYRTDETFVIKKEGETILYALWGYDTNGDGVADVLEKKYTLRYDLNGQGHEVEERTVGLTAPVTGLVRGDTLRLAEGRPTVLGDGTVEQKLYHAPAELDGVPTEVRFVGWSSTPLEKIYRRNETYSILGEIWTMQASDATVYAVWGFDADNDGIADVLEDTYQLIYDGNPQAGGFTGYIPDVMGGFIEGDTETLKKEPMPGHSSVRETAEGARVDVAFVGWTYDQHGLLGRADTGVLPQCLEEVTFGSENIRVYALWGRDENGDGVADVLEDKYTLHYESNEVQGSVTTPPPADVTELLAYEEVSLADCSPEKGGDGTLIQPLEHSSETYIDPQTGAETENVPVLFLGWTREENKKIYTWADAVSLLGDSVKILPSEDKTLTVYAAWGYDTDGNGIADAGETTYTLIYEENGLGGTVTRMPADSRVAGNLTGMEAQLVIDPKPLHSAKDTVPVVFIGWTMERTGRIYTQDDATAPITVEKVTFQHDDIHVYAAWGLDANRNGMADVFEDKYVISYHGNAQEDGSVSNVPQKETGILTGERTLSGGVPELALENGEQAIFLGWTRVQSEKIYDVRDAEPLVLDGAELVPQLFAPGERITVAENWDLYAVWAKDANADGIADYLQGLLVYDGNPVDGIVGKVPAEEIHSLTDKNGERVTALLADGETVPDAQNPIPLPKHSDVEGRRVAFLGWTKEAQDQIFERTFGRGGEETLPALLTDVQMEKEVTVYAAWGYDDNANGVPDVKESLYTLTYYGNAQSVQMADGTVRDGRVDAVPDAVTELLSGETVVLADGETVLQADGTPVPLPTHCDMPYTDAATGKTEDVPVLFLGWTDRPAAKLYAGGDEVPEGRLRYVKIADEDAQVYAAWGYDANRDGRADVFENERLLYVENGITGDERVKNMPQPNPQTGLYDGAVMELTGQTPEHEDENGSRVLFLGWTAERTTEIFEAGHNPPECLEEVLIDRREVKVYAAWGYDRNNNGTPDVVESCTLIYEGHPIVGQASGIPESRTGIAYRAEVELDGREPTHTEVNGSPVVFLGWTASATESIYERGMQAPECIARVRMNRASVTVYAAWGFDVNDNGIPDVREDFRLTYEANAQAGGTVSNMPLNITGLLAGEGGALSRRIPQHTPAELDGEDTDVVFIGWTAQRTDKIYSKRDTAPECVNSFVIEDTNVTVYAAWGYDMDKSGKADVLEDKYILTYVGSPVQGEISGIPQDDSLYLVGDEITLVKEGPRHSDVDGRKVIFLGWSFTQPDAICEPQTAPALLERVIMEEGGLTVYAVWGYANPLAKIEIPMELAGRKEVVSAGEQPFAYTMQGGEFLFALEPADANPQGDPVTGGIFTNEADGAVALIADAVYTETGVYRYTVRELAEPAIPGILYDGTVYEVTVTVTTDEIQAQAQTEIRKNGEEAEEIVFTNRYDPETAGVNLEGRKNLQGRDLTGGEFTFVLEPVGAEVEVYRPAQTEAAPEEMEADPAEAEAIAELPEEAAAETESETVTEAVTEAAAETAGETPTEAVTEAVTETESEAVTETPAEAQVLTCRYVPHVHTEECRGENGELACGYADYVVHTHSDSCYDSEGVLVCSLPELEEHIHDDSCYEWHEELVCGQAGTEGHVHTDSCYGDPVYTLICGMEETEGHTHGASCYVTERTLVCGLAEEAPHYHDEYCYDESGNLICGWAETAGHVHTDACYQTTSTLICPLTESAGHTHSESCYDVTVPLVCGMEETAGHTHDDSCWEYSYGLICGKQEVILHTHSASCYEYPEQYEEAMEAAEAGEETDADPGRLVCGMLEIKEHVHSAECFGAYTGDGAGLPAANVPAGYADETAVSGEPSYEEELILGEDPDLIYEAPEPIDIDVIAVPVPEELIGAAPEAATEMPAEAVTEAATEIPAEAATEAATETPAEAVTEAATEMPAEAVTEAATEMPSEAATEAATEIPTEEVTEAATEMPAEEATEIPTEVTTEPEAEASEGVSGETAEIIADAAAIADENAPQAEELEVTLQTLTAAEIPMPAEEQTNNTASGIFRFGAILYDRPGVYTYRLTEKNTGGSGMIFDETAYLVTVTVTRDEKTGTLSASAAVRKEGDAETAEAVFTNTYLPPQVEFTKTQSVNGKAASADVQEAGPGDTVTYYLTVANTASSGADAARDVVVTDVVPSGLILQEQTISNGGTTDYGAITWNLGDIPAQSSVTVSFSVKTPDVGANILRTNVGSMRIGNNLARADQWMQSNIVRVNILTPVESGTTNPSTPSGPTGPSDPGTPTGPAAGEPSTEPDAGESSTEPVTDEPETDEAGSDYEPSTSHAPENDGGTGDELYGSNVVGNGDGGGGTEASVPQTGDAAPILPYLLALAFSLAALAVAGNRKGKLRRSGRK